MPFLDPEELKPKLKEIFETMVIPQIIKAKMMDTDPTAVNSLIETLLPFIDRSRVSDTMLHAITEIHIAMEKDQIKDAWNDAYDKGTRDRLEKISNPVGNAEQYYNETFKSE
jgi:hypothetical protein